MKKIGLIALVAIFVLGSLGVGYALWSQTLSINGTVTTGNISFTVTAPTGTWVYKNPGATPEMDIYQGLESALAPPHPLTDVLIAHAVPTNLPQICAAGASGVTVNIDYTNLFPFVYGDPAVNHPWKADFTITNTGSIPVRAELGAFDFGTIGGYVTAKWIGIANGTEIEPNGTLDVSVEITVPDANTSQAQSGTLSGTITFVQFNEYAAGAYVP